MGPIRAGPGHVAAPLSAGVPLLVPRRVGGAGEDPAHGGALLVANHAGAIPADAPVIMHGIEEELGRPVYGLADYLFRSLPLVRTGWARAGGVAAHPDNAYRLLREQQQLVLVFPEGTKGTGKLYSRAIPAPALRPGRFRRDRHARGCPGGADRGRGQRGGHADGGQVARAGQARSACPYSPLTANMLLLGPLGLVCYLPAKFKLRVLDPVAFDVAPDQERYPQSRVFDEAEAIRQRMQSSLYDMLRTRRSVWFAADTTWDAGS